METLKTCNKCKKQKPLELFCRYKKGTFGVDSSCKTCKNVYVKKYNKMHDTAKKRYTNKRDLDYLSKL